MPRVLHSMTHWHLSKCHTFVFQVRDQGFKAMKGFLEKLEIASENPEKIAEFEAQVKAGGRSGLLDSEHVRSTNSTHKPLIHLTLQMPQWAGWALKTLSGKFYKSSTPPTAAAAAAGEKPSAAAADATARSESLEVPKKTLEKEPSTEVDGWGELEDDDGAAGGKLHVKEEAKDEAWADDWNEWSGTQQKVLGNIDTFTQC